MNLKYKGILKDYCMIVIGTCLVAMAYGWIYDPIHLVDGGFTGLAIVIKDVSKNIIKGGIPLWITNIGLNAPVFILAYIIMGKRFIGRTFFGTLMLSVWLGVLPAIDIPKGDYVIASVFGGFLAGVGLGLTFKSKATTGGTDMVAALIHKKVKHYSVAQIMQFVDFLIIAIGFMIFGLRSTLYAVIAITIASRTSDTILEGFKFSKAAYIITDKYDEIAETLLETLDRGVTGLEARGMYTGDDKCVLYCVVSKKEIVTLKEIVVRIDPRAFVIVSDVREVLGEGFIEYTKEHKKA
ncbi:YitT family protein [Lachnobacterium bovis]|uniref:YitT family protein n=1 Tax=Lachnobacterium bovis TaxID=140626 RepID=UPI00048987D4|nr:YitT family protein [Lachnobacterium bovis]